MRIRYFIKVITLFYFLSAGFLLAAGGIEPSHIELVVIICACVAAVVGFAAGVDKWVVEPRATTIVATHNYDEKSHSIAINKHNTSDDAHQNLVMERREEFHQLMNKLNTTLQEFSVTAAKHLALTEANGEKLNTLIKEHNDIKETNLCKMVSLANGISREFKKRANDPPDFDPATVRTRSDRRAADELRSAFDDLIKAQGFDNDDPPTS